MVDNDYTKDIRKVVDGKFKPTERSSRFLQIMGTKQTLNGIRNRLIKIRCNDDKTFDIISTKLMVDQVLDKTRKSLDERGYVLTPKGENFILNKFSNDNFIESLTKMTGLTDMPKDFMQ